MVTRTSSGARAASRAAHRRLGAGAELAADAGAVTPDEDE
jgi:hypothetical protein